CSSERSNTPSSSFTAMRSAWKTRLAGCPPVLLNLCGICDLIISVSSVVVSIGTSARLRSISLAIFLENFSSPYLKKNAGGLKYRSEEHTSELQSRCDLVCRLLLEKRL